MPLNCAAVSPEQPNRKIFALLNATPGNVGRAAPPAMLAMFGSVLDIFGAPREAYQVKDAGTFRERENQEPCINA